MAADVEKVAILYEQPSLSNSDEFDLVKLAKFLKRLSKTVSCTILTTHEFCDEKATVEKSKRTKIVLFVRNADTLKETVANVQKRFDAEIAVEMKTVVTAPTDAKLAAPRGDVIRCESFEEVSDWYPHILVFLFERKQRRDRKAVFMIDFKMDAEMEWFKKIKEVCSKFNKTCVWTGNLPLRLTLNDETVDTVVVLSWRKGYEVLLRHNNDAHLHMLASFCHINFLVFTNNERGEAVRAAREYRNKFGSPHPIIIKCKNNLELDYKTWTLLLKKMSIIDCEDVTYRDWAALKIVAMVVLVIILIPVVFVMLVAWAVGYYMFPRLTRDLFRSYGY